MPISSVVGADDRGFASQSHQFSIRTAMSLDRYIRIIAGSFVLISLALAHWVSPYWLLFTAFVGLNLFQSGFTKWCLMEEILKKLGVGRPAESAQESLS